MNLVMLLFLKEIQTVNNTIYKILGESSKLARKRRKVLATQYTVYQDLIYRRKEDLLNKKSRKLGTY